MSKALSEFFNKFHIGTYILERYARSEQHIKDLQECGIDVVFGVDNDKSTLDLFQKYGISAVVSGVVPGWFGGRGENAGLLKEINTKEAYIKGAQNFTDHPAIIGIDFGDEPSSLDFPYYGDILRMSRKLFPNKFLYLNIYPSYGMSADSDEAQIKKELGKSSFKEYLCSYCENIELNYLSFDHYAYSSNPDSFLSDLTDAAKCCKEYNKKLFVVLQVNSHKQDTYISENQLRFQAFSALAFGVSAISWACYTAGWWYNQVLDCNGNKTEQYEKLKRVNCELRGLTRELILYKWLNTIKISNKGTISFDVFTEITSSAAALLGEFRNNEGKRAIFYSPLNFGSNKNNKLKFKLIDYKKAYSHTKNGKNEIYPNTHGVFTIDLENTEACFITLI